MEFYWGGVDASKADPGILKYCFFFCCSEVRKELSLCGRICGDSPKQKIEKQNELDAKFTDKRYKTDQKNESKNLHYVLKTKS